MPPFARPLARLALGAALVLAAAHSAAPLAAQAVASPRPPAPAADSAAVRSAVLDYVEGWWAADSARMRRALHPALAKRIVVREPDAARERLDAMTADRLVAGTGAGYGTRTPAALRRRDVRILDLDGGMASAKLDAGPFADYLHLARVDGRWVIVNVLWAMRPSAQPAAR